MKIMHPNFMMYLVFFCNEIQTDTKLLCGWKIWRTRFVWTRIRHTGAIFLHLLFVVAEKSSTKQVLVKMKLQIFTANPFTLCAVVQLKILCRYMLHFQRKRGRSHKKGPTDQITTCLIFKSMLPHLLRMPKYEPKKVYNNEEFFKDLRRTS